MRLIPEIVDRIIQTLKSSERWIVLVHEKPDGDTLGTSAALVSAGKRIGKDVIWGGRDAIPPQYCFLDTAGNYSVLGALPDICPVDLLKTAVICCDTSTVSRSVTDLLRYAPQVPLINIDHHKDNERYGTLNWVDAAASATGEMMTELLSISGWGIEPSEADDLYASIISDNGGFRFTSTSVKSHRMAILLLESGASPSNVARALEQRMTVTGMHLWGRAFSRAYTFAGGKAAICALKQEDFVETTSLPTETEGLVNTLLYLGGVGLVALCTEQGGEVRVNLRAYPPYSARDVAVCFGGGGHELASGCRICLPLHSAVEKLSEEMTRHVRTVTVAPI